MMMKLDKSFTTAEQKVISIWQSEELSILTEIEDDICFILYERGYLTYEMCFGEESDSYLKSLRFIKAIPKKVIKFDRFYLLENHGEPGEWYVGERHTSGKILFYKNCCNLEYAFDSL